TIEYICFFFFFFSSRRRHTRSLRDWSSDVCSSDLISVENNQYATEIAFKNVARVQDVSARAAGYGLPGVTVDGNDVLAVYEVARSEERRVGKECRSRWSPDHEKKEMTTEEDSRPNT